MHAKKQTNKQTKNSAYKFVSCFSSRFGGGTRRKGEEEREGKGGPMGRGGVREPRGRETLEEGYPWPPLPIRPMTLTPK